MTAISDYTTEQLEQDVQRFLYLDAERKEIEEEQGRIKERLRNLGIGKHNAAGMVVSVTTQRRFNTDRAREVIPPELLNLCEATVIDTKKAKAVLPPAVYEAAMIEVGDPRVVIA